MDAPSSLTPHVTAVVVSFNRRDLLVEAIDALRAQKSPVSILVVDNASTDGSANAAEELIGAENVLRLPTNTGGAGGFAVGIAAAVARDPEWIWLMDDDTIPTPSASQELLDIVRRSPPAVTVLGSTVRWTDGRDHPMNTPRPNPMAGRRAGRLAAKLGVRAVRSSSFVSMMVRTDRVREVGLPVAGYFLWNDDFEYSTRLIRGRAGLFVPGEGVVHKTARLASSTDDPGDRFHFEVRNKVWLFTRSKALAPWEKVVFGAATAVRWIRTFRGSSDRGVLREALIRGLADGLRTAPPSNAEVFAGTGAAAAAVAAFEGSR